MTATVYPRCVQSRKGDKLYCNNCDRNWNDLKRFTEKEFKPVQGTVRLYRVNDTGLVLKMTRHSRDEKTQSKWRSQVLNKEDFKAAGNEYVNVQMEWTVRKMGRREDSGDNRPYPPCQGLQPHSVWVCSGTQLCPTLCDPMDHSPPSSCVHAICQARIWEWVAISSARESS